MEKITIDTNIAESPYSPIGKIGDKSVEAKKYLSYKEKEDVAYAMVELGSFIDEEYGLMIDMVGHKAIEYILIVGAYTNIDTSAWMTPENAKELYALLQREGIVDALEEHASKDLSILYDLYFDVLDGVQQKIHAEHSLEQKVLKALGGILGDESFAETVSKSEGINSFLVNAFMALNNGKNESKAKEAGGNMINFSKRRKE